MNSDFPRSDLTPIYSISQVLKGGWQLSEGHSRMMDEQQAIEDMRSFVEAGITTFDCADIYTGVEELIGKFLKKYKSTFESGELPAVQVHTKCVPDLDELPIFSKAYTEALERNPDDYVALTGLGLLELKRGNTEAALDHFRTAAIDVFHVLKCTNLGGNYSGLGPADPTMSFLSRNITIDDVP